MDLDDLISQSDAARLRNVKPPRVSQWIKANRLEVFTVAGKPLVSRIAVMALEALPTGRRPKANGVVTQLVKSITEPKAAKAKKNQTAKSVTKLKAKKPRRANIKTS